MRKHSSGALLLEDGDRVPGKYGEAREFAKKTGALANTPPKQNGYRFKVIEVGETSVHIMTEPEMMEYFGLDPVTAQAKEVARPTSNAQRPPRWDTKTGRLLR